MKTIPIVFLFSLLAMQVLGGRNFLVKKQNATALNQTALTVEPTPALAAINLPITGDPAALANASVSNGNDTLLSINSTNSGRMNAIPINVQPIIQVPVDNIAQVPSQASPVIQVPIAAQPAIVAPTQVPIIPQPAVAVPIAVQPVDASSVLQVPTQAQPAIAVPIATQPTISAPVIGNTVQVPVDVASVNQVPINSASIAQVPVTPINTAAVPIAQVPIDTSRIAQVPVTSANIAQVPVNSASIAQVPLTSNVVMQAPPLLSTASLNLDKIASLSPTLNAKIQVTQIPQTAFNWAPTSMMANDVGVSAEGDIYVAGLDGKLYSYNFATASYTRVIADPDLDNITRVSVDGEGTPYVITGCGASYYLSCDNKWIQLPGCASDIGAGSCGQIWKTGCDQRTNGFGIWKLFCSGEEKKCKRYRQFTSYSTCDQTSKKRECYWYRVSGSGVRVGVFPDGKPAIVQSNGAAIKYDGNEWKMITQFPARDITISNENMVIISGATSGMYFIPSKPTQTRDDFFDERYGFSLFAPESAVQQTIEEPLDARTRYLDVGCTMALSSGPYSQPTIIPCITQYQPIVALTQKFNYN